MDKRDYPIILLLFLLGVVTRLPFVEKMQSHWDGPQWSIGIVRYSLKQETPAPPGYPLYIGLGKIVNLFTDDPHTALVLISVFFSGIGAVVFFIAGKNFFNRTIGIICSALFLTGPTFYFFGLTAYPYLLLAVNSALFVLLTYEIVIKNKKWGIVLGIVFAFILGIRPLEFIFLFPLFLYALRSLPSKQIQFALISLILCTFMWLVPLVYVSGGVIEYIKISSLFAKKGALPSPMLIRSTNDYMMLVKGLFLSFGLATFFLFYYVNVFMNKQKLIKKLLNNKKIIMFLLLIVPALTFNLFIRSDHAGHQMTYLSGILLLISYALWNSLNKNKKLFYPVFSIILIFNTWWFFRDRDPKFIKPYIPTSFHHSEIRKNDIRLSAKNNYIKSNYASNNTLLVTSGDLWRPFIYYLPQFTIYDIAGLTNDSEKFKFIQRFSKNWDFVEEINKNKSFHIPSGFKYMILVDDDSGNWKINQHIKKIRLDGNGTMIIITVKEYDNFLYDRGVLNLL